MTSTILSFLVMIEINPLLHMRYIIPSYHCKDPKTEFSIGNQCFKILQTPSLFPYLTKTQQADKSQSLWIGPLNLTG